MTCGWKRSAGRTEGEVQAAKLVTGSQEPLQGAVPYQMGCSLAPRRELLGVPSPALVRIKVRPSLAPTRGGELGAGHVHPSPGPQGSARTRAEPGFTWSRPATSKNGVQTVGALVRRITRSTAAPHSLHAAGTRPSSDHHLAPAHGSQDVCATGLEVGDRRPRPRRAGPTGSGSIPPPAPGPGLHPARPPGRAGGPESPIGASRARGDSAHSPRREPESAGAGQDPPARSPGEPPAPRSSPWRRRGHPRPPRRSPGALSAPASRPAGPRVPRGSRSRAAAWCLRRGGCGARYLKSPHLPRRARGFGGRRRLAQRGSRSRPSAATVGLASRPSVRCDTENASLPRSLGLTLNAPELDVSQAGVRACVRSARPMTSRRRRRPSYVSGRAGAESGSARAPGRPIWAAVRRRGARGRGASGSVRPAAAEGLCWGLDLLRPASLRPEWSGEPEPEGSPRVRGAWAGRPHLWPHVPTCRESGRWLSPHSPRGCPFPGE